MDGQPAVRVVRPRPLGLNDRIPVFWAGQEPTQELKQIDGGALYRHLVAASTPTGSKKRKRAHKYQAPKEGEPDDHFPAGQEGVQQQQALQQPGPTGGPIVIPRVRPVVDYEVNKQAMAHLGSMFEGDIAAAPYLRHKEHADIYDEHQAAEYDVDEDDIAWLNTVNCKNGQTGLLAAAIGLYHQVSARISGSHDHATGSEPQQPQQPQQQQHPLRLSVDDFEKALDILEKAHFSAVKAWWDEEQAGPSTSAPRVPTIPAMKALLPRAAALEALSGLLADRKLAAQVLDYWLKKRADAGGPLLARLWFEQPWKLVAFAHDIIDDDEDYDENLPFMAVEPRSKQRQSRRGGQRRKLSEEDALEALYALRNELETVRTLADQVRKREKLKRQLLLLSQQEWQMRQQLALPPGKLPAACTQRAAAGRQVAGAAGAGRRVQSTAAAGAAGAGPSGLAGGPAGGPSAAGLPSPPGSPNTQLNKALARVTMAAAAAASPHEGEKARQTRTAAAAAAAEFELTVAAKRRRLLASAAAAEAETAAAAAAAAAAAPPLPKQAVAPPLSRAGRGAAAAAAAAGATAEDGVLPELDQQAARRGRRATAANSQQHRPAVDRRSRQPAAAAAAAAAAARAADAPAAGPAGGGGEAHNLSSPGHSPSPSAAGADSDFKLDSDMRAQERSDDAQLPSSLVDEGTPLDGATEQQSRPQRRQAARLVGQAAERRRRTGGPATAAIARAAAAAAAESADEAGSGGVSSGGSGSDDDRPGPLQGDRRIRARARTAAAQSQPEQQQQQKLQPQLKHQQRDMRARQQQHVQPEEEPKRPAQRQLEARGQQQAAAQRRATRRTASLQPAVAVLPAVASSSELQADASRDTDSDSAVLPRKKRKPLAADATTAPPAAAAGRRVVQPAAAAGDGPDDASQVLRPHNKQPKHNRGAHTEAHKSSHKPAAAAAPDEGGPLNAAAASSGKGPAAVGSNPKGHRGGGVRRSSSGAAPTAPGRHAAQVPRRRQRPPARRGGVSQAELRALGAGTDADALQPRRKRS